MGIVILFHVTPGATKQRVHREKKHLFRRFPNKRVPDVLNPKQRVVDRPRKTRCNVKTTRCRVVPTQKKRQRVVADRRVSIAKGVEK